jgi:hypothetical protein
MMPAVINGYCDELSGFPGQTVTLRVATDAAAFAVHVYRQGAALEGPLLSTSWIDGAGTAARSTSRPTTGASRVTGSSRATTATVTPSWPSTTATSTSSSSARSRSAG